MNGSRRTKHGSPGAGAALIPIVAITLGLLAAPGPVAAEASAGPTGRAGVASSPDVRIALDLALSRLRYGRYCRELFEAEGADGAALLDRATFRWATDKEWSKICRERDAALFTTMRGSEIVICPAEFQQLTLERRAALLIHEALHHSGVGERPLDPDAVSPAQLTSLVERRCSL